MALNFFFVIFAISMKESIKEIILYSAMFGIVFSGVNAIWDWRRGALDSFWWYLLYALAMFVIMAGTRYFTMRKKKRQKKS